MALPQVIAPTPRDAAPALPGTWKLAAGRAVTLEPREAGVLKVAHGQMWVTQDGPHGGPANDLGDVVLGAGEQVPLREGQRLVIEAWNHHGAPAYFSWDPLPVSPEAPVPVAAAVVQPLADLRRAGTLAAGAIGRLVTGLARVGWHVVAGRARPTLEEQACCRHGVAG